MKCFYLYHDLNVPYVSSTGDLKIENGNFFHKKPPH